LRWQPTEAMNRATGMIITMRPVMPLIDRG
jgi:hypothetical protein